MEKMFPWGQRAAVTSHEGNEKGGGTTRVMGERQHSGQKTKQGGLGFLRGSATSSQHHAKKLHTGGLKEKSEGCRGRVTE